MTRTDPFTRLTEAFADTQPLKERLLTVLRALPRDVQRDFLEDPRFRISREQYVDGKGWTLWMDCPSPVRGQGAARGGSRCVVLRGRLAECPLDFAHYVIAHELAHAHLHNGGWGEIHDPEEAADALAASWGFRRPAEPPRFAPPPESPPATDFPAPETAFVDVGNYRKIVLLTSGYSTPFLAKTAISLLRYRREDIVAVLEAETDARTAGELFGVGGDTPVARRLGEVPDADAVFIGIAPPGGNLPDSWRPLLHNAIARGMDLVSGLHDFLSDDLDLAAAAQGHGRRLVDVRRNRFKRTAKCYPFRESCLRVHTVGHDCTVGKMSAALEIQRELTRRRHDAKFLATGQTGIMVTGEGVPIDCVVSDFVNGAIEDLVRRNEQHDFLIVEGQGSVSHPAYSAVTLGLLHGAAPQGLVFCYEAGRDLVKGFGDTPIPPLRKLVEAVETMANLRHPSRVIGFAVNTRNLSADEAAAEVRRIVDEFRLPACDVYRHGPGPLADAVESLRTEVLSR